VKHTGKTDESETIINGGGLTGMTSVLGTIENKDFQDYLKSDAGKADLDAYMASMKIISDTTKDSPDTIKDVLANGFDDSQLNTLLGNLMGNNTGK